MFERTEIMLAMRIVGLAELIELNDLAENGGLIRIGQGGYAGGHEALASAAQ
jgi:hypothetical protein